MAQATHTPFFYGTVMNPSCGGLQCMQLQSDLALPRTTHRAMSRLHNLLRKKKKPDKCGFCHIVIVKDDRHTGVFYKVPPDDGDDQKEGGTIHQVCFLQQ